MDSETQTMLPQAIADHEAYEGKEVFVSQINLAPNGWEDLDQELRVTVGDLSFEEINDGIVDIYWNVALQPDELARLCSLYPYISKNAPDAYIRAYSYELDKDGTVFSSECEFRKLCQLDREEDPEIMAASL